MLHNLVTPISKPYSVTKIRQDLIKASKTKTFLERNFDCSKALKAEINKKWGGKIAYPKVKHCIVLRPAYS